MAPIKIKKAFAKIILAIFLLSFPFFAHASGFAIHLYFNAANKTLTFDKQASAPVTLDDTIQIDPVTFSENQTPGNYVLKLYDTNNEEIVSTEFNQQSGAFVVQLPYFSPANSMKILDKVSGKEILNADLSQYNTCNGNGICEFEKGENVTTCLGDCGTSHVTYSDQTKKLLLQNGGVLKDPKTGQVLLKDQALANNSPSTKSSGQSQNTAPSGANYPIPTSGNQQNSQATPQTVTSSSNPVLLPIILLVLVLIVVIVVFIFFKRFKR